MFSFNNHKIKQTGRDYGLKSCSFDLLSGRTCPMANECHSEVHIKKGKRFIKDYGQYRCYATKADVQYSRVYEFRKRNFEMSQKENFVEIVLGELAYFEVELCRIHSSGDFYNYQYFQKWIEIAKRAPHVIFFGYSKQATFVHWLIKNPLPNMKLNYSMGGLMDKYALENDLPRTYVMTKENAHTMENVQLAGTPEDYTDDFRLIMAGETFKIKLH